MAGSYDDQLLEATAVRRKRLVETLLFGPARHRREWTDRVGSYLAGAFVAVLICAGCVAASFLIHLFSKGTGPGSTGLLPQSTPTVSVSPTQPGLPGPPTTTGGNR